MKLRKYLAAMCSVCLVFNGCTMYHSPKTNQYARFTYFHPEKGLEMIKPQTLSYEEYIAQGGLDLPQEEMESYGHVTSKESFVRDFKLERFPELSDYTRSGKMMNAKTSRARFDWKSRGIAGELASHLGFWLVLETRRRWYEKVVEGGLIPKYHWKATKEHKKHSSSIWAPLELVQERHIDEPKFDLAFYEHVWGKHNELVGRKLREELSMKMREDSKKAFVAFAGSSMLIYDSDELPTLPLFEQYYPAQFSEHILEEVYGLPNLDKYYSNSRFSESAFMKENYLTGNNNSSLNQTRGKCFLDNNYTQITMPIQTRVQFNCVWKPEPTSNFKYNVYLSDLYRKRVMNRGNPPNPKITSQADWVEKTFSYAVPTSQNTFYSMNTKSLIPRTYMGSGMYNAFVAMRFEDKAFKSAIHFGMKIAQELPPFALVAWLYRDHEALYGLVFHHGILWRYDLTKLAKHFEEKRAPLPYSKTESK